LAQEIHEGEAQPKADEQVEVLRVPLSEATKMVGGRIRGGEADRAVAL
jgi:hypothetical protein